VVTGGSLGIGREIARAFCGAGDTVVLVAREPGALEAAAEELRRAGGRAETAVCDVSDDAAVEAAVRGILDAHGRVDVLVNSAGIYGPVGPFVENDLGAWCETVEVNLLGAVRTTRRLLPGMIERRQGSVINLSGGGATGPKPGYSAYAATKTALVRFTEIVAHEVAPYGIRVNAIAPGFVATRLHRATLEAGTAAPDHAQVEQKLRQGGDDPRRAAELALFLADERSSGVSGRLISAIWDDWASLADRGPELEGSDLFTLRRIDDMFYREVPRE
jgi:3-oxoacyl-[acyl-carrier protein] reductase